MVFKITNSIRILSIIALVIVFFISYAGLPEQVLVLLDGDGAPVQYVTRNLFFYSSLAFIVLGNTLLYVLSAILIASPQKVFRVVANYIVVLTALINLFFIVSLSFISILNSRENFDYTNFAPFFYLSEGLFAVWLMAFIYSLVTAKKDV
ncbi:MAG: hypothetical protein KDC79_09205 [Cyclobacteriaceae bacterium]|nr:hypothetical protein [Cyclobacteriaceae bacterium]